MEINSVNSLQNSSVNSLQKNSVSPMNNIRKFVREEMELNEKLKKLEAQYNAGEISKFEYMTNKVLLNWEYADNRTVPQAYSTTA